MKIPSEAKKLLEEDPIYLATTDGSWPNVTVTQSSVILSDDEFLICDCAMTKAKENILQNPNCCFEAYDDKTETGYKGFGKATYYSEGKQLDIAKERLTNEPFNPKGAVVIKIEKIFKVE